LATVTEPARDIPVVDQVDVLVVGGGPAGLAAAVSAARLGARVGLIERYGSLGGLATGGLVLLMDGVFDNAGERMIGGLFWELMGQLREADGLAEETPLRLHVDSEILKVVADRVCRTSGVLVRLHCWATDAVMEDGRITGVIYQSKSGRRAVLGGVVVDATGDGDMACSAGAPFELHNQRIGLNYKIGGVNLSQFQEYRDLNGEELAQLISDLRRRGGYPISLGATPHSEAGVFWVNVRGLSGRDTDSSSPNAEGGDPGQRVVDHFAGNLSALSEEDLSYAETELRERILATLEFYRTYVPGFGGVRLLSFASQIGVRDSRRITGVRRLTREDVQGAAPTGDSVGRAALVFGTRHGFAIPYGALVPENVDCLLAAGRCISTDSWVQQTTRLIPPALVTGQAAGVAAALAVQTNADVKDLDPEKLKELLADQDVIL
jgi:hypothetical protein